MFVLIFIFVFSFLEKLIEVDCGESHRSPSQIGESHRILPLREYFFQRMEFRLARTIGPAANDKDFRGASEVVGSRSMHIKEILLTIVVTAFLLRQGYYQVRRPAKMAEAYNNDRKYPLSEGHIRFMGWMMLLMALPMALVCLYAVAMWIIGALPNADFYISGAVLLILLLAIAIGVYIFLRKRRSSKPVSKNREEWVKSYLKQHPEAPPLQIIGAYNSHRELGEQWGYFSLREMKRLVVKIKNDELQ